MKNIWTRIGLNHWFGFGIGLAGGGIFLTSVWTGHFTDLVLVASTTNSNDPNLDSVKQFLLIIKNLSIFSFIASFICLVVGLLKAQRNQRS
jgi:hypothetical protein